MHIQPLFCDLGYMADALLKEVPRNAMEVPPVCLSARATLAVIKGVSLPSQSSQLILVTCSLLLFHFGFSNMKRKRSWSQTRKLLGRGLRSSVWDSQLHGLSVTSTYASFLRDYSVQGNMLGDMTFRKIPSVGDFSLVCLEYTYRKFPEEVECVRGQTPRTRYTDWEEVITSLGLANQAMLTFLVISLVGQRSQNLFLPPTKHSYLDF